MRRWKTARTGNRHGKPRNAIKNYRKRNFEKKKTALHLPPEQLTAALLDERVECYVMAADGAWSYIVTHEGDPLGPYFIKKP